jgi:hypothetical protein
MILAGLFESGKLLKAILALVLAPAEFLHVPEPAPEWFKNR